MYGYVEFLVKLVQSLRIGAGNILLNTSYKKGLPDCVISKVWGPVSDTISTFNYQGF